MHSQNDYQPVPKQVINPKKQKELNGLLNSQKNSDDFSKQIIETLKNTLNEYKEEMDTIQKVAASFGYLLNKHSNSVNININFFNFLIFYKCFSVCKPVY